MAKIGRKVKDSDFKNKLDRRQSNKIVRQFAKKLIDSQRDIEPEISCIVQKNFMDLL